MVGLAVCRLFDRTANAQLWRFDAPYMVWGPDDITETVRTYLDADHVYVLHLHTYGVSYGEGTFGTNLRVSNLHVPDNADTFVCLCRGLLVALLGTWKLRT